MSELLNQFRQQNPDYRDVPDDKLADGLYRKFYAGQMDRSAFDAKVGLDVGQESEPGGVDDKGGFQDAAALGQEEMQPDDWRSGFWGGVVRGTRDTVDAGAQIATRGGELMYGEPAKLLGFPEVKEWFTEQRKDVENINADAEREYQQEWRGGDDGLDWGRIAGNYASTLPLMGSGGAWTVAARQGATAAAAQPVYDTDNFLGNKAAQLTLGAGGGVVGQKATKLAAGLLQPQLAKGAQAMKNANVRMTPGQIMGGGARRAEEKLRSFPIVGDMIQAGERQGIRDFNLAAANEVLRPIGVKADGVKAGRDLANYVSDTISNAYDKTLTKIGSVRLDKEFVGEFQNLQSMAGTMLPQRAKQFSNIIRDKLARHISPGGGITAESVKGAQSELRRASFDYSGSLDPDARQLGDALRESAASLTRLIGRNYPDLAKDLARTDAAYAKSLRFMEAAGRQGTDASVFTPAQLTGAVRNQAGKGAKAKARNFAKGEALMQDFAEAGKGTISNQYPDSGTAGRMILNTVALGGGSGYAAANPEVVSDPAVWGPLAFGAAIYSKPGQRMLAKLLAGQRPQVMGTAANQLRRAAPAASLAGGSLAARLNQY